jgi:dienelactone hydrolase
MDMRCGIHARLLLAALATLAGGCQGELAATQGSVPLGDGATLAVANRLDATDEPRVVLPDPSGPFAVGTAALIVFDASRPGNTREGRALPLRLWYPAVASDQELAPYFLDARQAEQNLLASPLPLPDDLYERTRGAAREHVTAADGAARPALILSTEWGAPVETYAALAEDLASHGYLVLGINHPNGSGVVVYPDGSRPNLDPLGVIPDEANNRDWALDIEHVADWLQQTPSAAAARASLDERARPNVRAALGQLDDARIGALGHSFGGAAAVRADAESSAIVASADLDGALVGDAARFGERARALLVRSPHHSELDSSIGTFLGAAGSDCRGLIIADTLHSNYGDTNWLYRSALDDYPDLTPEGYGLGPIEPGRAHVILTTYVRAFFQATLDGQPSALLEGPDVRYPEVMFR